MKNSKIEFKVYKEGVTGGFVSILSVEGEYFNFVMKVAKYKYLGYVVYNVEGEEI